MTKKHMSVVLKICVNSRYYYSTCKRTRLSQYIIIVYCKPFLPVFLELLTFHVAPNLDGLVCLTEHTNVVLYCFRRGKGGYTEGVAAVAGVRRTV